MRVYLDSCVLVYRVEQQAPWAAWVNRELAALEASGATIVVSELTRMECRLLPLALGRLDILDAYDRLFAQEALEWQALDRPVFELATRLRAEQRLKTPDALHLAAAITAGCDHLMTNDQRLARAGSPGITMITLDPSA